MITNICKAEKDVRISLNHHRQLVNASITNVNKHCLRETGTQFYKQISNVKQKREDRQTVRKQHTNKDRGDGAQW